jgi:hypothetical protein
MTIKRDIDIDGGYNVRRNKRRIGRPLIAAWLAIGLILSASSAFAQGSIFGAVTNSNTSVPANGQISFFGYLDNTDEEIRIETSAGAGYDAGYWFDDFQNYLTEAPGNPYDYHFYNTANGEGFVLSKTIPSNSFQQEDINLAAVAWPGAPTGLAGYAISGSSVLITWNGVPGLTYHVYRRMASSNGSFFRLDNPAGSLAAPGVADSFFVDATADGASSYNYLIIAQDESGNLGPHSAIITVNAANIQAPVLASINPTTGVNTGGTPVNIYGSGFDPAGTSVSFGGTSVPGTYISPYHLTVVAPPGANGAADVFVVNTASGLASNTLVGGFTYYFNAAPIVADIPDQTIAEGATFATINLDDYVSDIDNADSEISWTYSGNAQLTVSIVSRVATITIPNIDWNGAETITFTATDPGSLSDSDPATFTVTAVNDAPVVADIPDQTIAQGASFAAINLDDFVADVDNIDGEIVWTYSGNAQLTVNIDGSRVATIAPPSPGWNGSETITFTATDPGLLFDSDAAVFTVTGDNDPPILNPIGSQTVAENANLHLVIAASDPEGVVPTLSATGLPGNSTFNDNLDGTGVFDFNPDFTQAGVYNITFKAFDGTLVDSEVVAVTVTNTNRPPELAAIGTQSTVEGTNLTFAVSASDPDLENLTITTSTLPNGASYVDNGDGTGTFNWTPSFVQAGAHSVTFYASDGIDVDSEIVAITVIEAGNQAPILDSIRARSIVEGSTLAITVTASDPDATIPTLSADSLPTNATFVDHGNGSGTFTFIPSFAQAGSYNVLFIASDGSLADSELVRITVTESGNQAPIVADVPDTSINEGDSIVIVVTATDPESSPISLGVSTSMTGYSFVDSGNGVGVFRYLSNYMSAGTRVIRFIATDNGVPPLSSSDTTLLTINEVNQAPTIDSIGPFSVRVGRTLVFTVQGRDTTDQNLSHRLYLSASNMPSGATFIDNNNNTGTFSFTPVAGQAGVYVITFMATDMGVPALSAIRNVQVTVVNQNNAPVFTTLPSSGMVTEGDTLQFIVRATDADGQAIILSMVKGPLHSSFVDSGNGTGLFTFMPSYVQAGLHQAVFEATDGIDVERSNPVLIEVIEAGNQPPTIEPIPPQSLTEGETLYTHIVAYDPDEISISVTVDSLPVNAQFIDSGNGRGVIVFTPGYLQSGEYTVYVRATDGTFTFYATFTITVIEAGNQPPLITNTVNSYSIVENQTLYFNVFVVDPDSSGKPNQWATNLPPGATFIVNDTLYRGAFSWTPSYYDSGQYTVNFFASDSTDPTLVDTFIVNIHVGNVNQVPVFNFPQEGADVYEMSTLIFRAYARDPYDSILPIVRFYMIEFVDPDLGTYDTLYEPLPNMTFTYYDSGLTAISMMTFSPDYSQGLPKAYGGQVFYVHWITLDGLDTLLQTTSGAKRINIYQTNAPPSIDPIPDTSIVENTTLRFMVIGRDVDFDNDGYPPRPEVTYDPATFPTNATFTGLLSNYKTFTFTPDFTQAGVYNVRFFATDDTLSDTEDVVITVIEAGNQLPYFTSTFPDTQVAIIGSVLNNRLTAVDPELETITITSSTLPTYATFVDSGNGIAGFRFNANVSQLGMVFQVQFYANDASGGADTLTNYYRVAEFLRGDANSDGRLDVSDVMFIVNFLYKAGRTPASFEASDVNFDQAIDLKDATYLNNYFYKQGPPPVGGE